MWRPFSPADRLTRARAVVAHACLGPLPRERLGGITLREDQRDTIRRATRMIAACGGCVIAEEVGRGKTFVALALARDWRRALVVAPAVLRETWRVASARADVTTCFISHESLSRGTTPGEMFDGVIVDESHHYRTTSTRRYEILVELTAARVPIVLLSATPVQNRARDLAAQVALFLGEAAFHMDEANLSRFVLRNAEPPSAAMPVVAAPEWLEIDANDGEVLDAILGLPASVALRDGGTADVLRTISLVRAWASSRAALRDRIRARRRVATAVEQGLAEQRLPSRREVRSWTGIDRDIQLGFAALLIDDAVDVRRCSELREGITRELEALARLASLLRELPDPDVARCQAIRALVRANPDVPVLAFSNFSSTVAAHHASLRDLDGVGLLTARSARIASGHISRSELLERFAPLAQGARRPHERERVTLLLATDLLAEGMNLQDAGIVLHLDLPWNPARLAQRVGRVRRPGGVAYVRTYVLAPPARAASLLALEARLRRKLATSRTLVGTTFDVLPALSRDAALARVDGRRAMHLDAEARGEMHACIARWSNDAALPIHELPVFAAVSSDRTGWLAALSDGTLVARLSGDTSGERMVLDALRQANAPSVQPCPEAFEQALRELDEWRAALLIGELTAASPLSSVARDNALALLLRAAATIPRHERAGAAPAIAQLRLMLGRPMSLGLERRFLRRMQTLETTDNAAGALRAIADEIPCEQLPKERHELVSLILFESPDADQRLAAKSPTASICL